MKTTADKTHKMPIFEKRFHELREAEEMSQDSFSKFLGISRPTVGFYENGDRIPDALTLAKIARKCNVSSDWLLGLADSFLASEVLIERTTGLTPNAIDILNLESSEDIGAFSNKVMVNAFITSGYFMKMLHWIAANITMLEESRRASEELSETAYRESLISESEYEELLGSDLGDSEYLGIVERSKYRFLRDVEHIYDEMIIKFSDKCGDALVKAKREEAAWLDELLEDRIKRQSENQED